MGRFDGRPSSAPQDPRPPRGPSYQPRLVDVGSLPNQPVGHFEPVSNGSPHERNEIRLAG